MTSTRSIGGLGIERIMVLLYLDAKLVLSLRFSQLSRDICTFCLASPLLLPAEMPTFTPERRSAPSLHFDFYFAFAIISRLAKSLGNSVGIKSTKIICEGLPVCGCALKSRLAMLTPSGVVHSYEISGVQFRGRPVLNAIRRAPRLSFILRFAD